MTKKITKAVDLSAAPTAANWPPKSLTKPSDPHFKWARVCMFDLHGVSGMFGMIAAMYFIFAIAVQFAPETFGRSIEEGAGGQSHPEQESAAAGVVAAGQERTV